MQFRTASKLKDGEDAVIFVRKVDDIKDEAQVLQVLGKKLLPDKTAKEVANIIADAAGKHVWTRELGAGRLGKNTAFLKEVRSFAQARREVFYL